MCRLRTLPGLALMVAIAACPESIRGQADDPAVVRGVGVLKGLGRSLPPGEAALAGLALVKADVPVDDAGLQACLARVETCFSNATYTPALAGPAGHSIYEAAVMALLYANLEAEAYRARIEALSRYIQGNQMSNGGWDYGHRMNGPNGDTSISQYAILGLWEAENAGVRIPAQVWDRAARWFISKQGPTGGWNYHRDERNRPDTISMTAAGVGSLLICKRQLERHAAPPEVKKATSSLLTPVLADPSAGIGPQGYRATTPTSAINASINRGLDWLRANWTIAGGPIMGESVFYGLYGLERIGALSGQSEIGGHDWFTEGRSFLISSQQSTGGWGAQYGVGPNTSWGVLFLTRSTEKSVRRVEVARLGAGTLIGGRGLPQDLTSLTIAGGRVLVKPMNGAIEAMLAVLEDPRSEQANEALAGLIERYHNEGPAALRPHKPRFRKLLSDSDPGIRAVAAWALGRTADLDVTPDLIAALHDDDPAVVTQARDGLRLLSRKIEGYGPPDGASAEEKRQAAQRWQSWYDAIRPPDFAPPVDRAG